MYFSAQYVVSTHCPWHFFFWHRCSVKKFNFSGFHCHWKHPVQSGCILCLCLDDLFMYSGKSLLQGFGLSDNRLPPFSAKQSVRTSSMNKSRHKDWFSYNKLFIHVVQRKCSMFLDPVIKETHTGNRELIKVTWTKQGVSCILCFFALFLDIALNHFVVNRWLAL